MREQKLRFDSHNIVFQEVPNETSLLFSITGCPHRCKGCHSYELWNSANGSPLTSEIYIELLTKYDGLITCVCFFGGEWHQNKLTEMLKTARTAGLKTCLYTGSNVVAAEIYEQLDYLKTGKWNARKGGLNTPTTNQKMICTKSGTNLNRHFHDHERELSC